MPTDIISNNTATDKIQTYAGTSQVFDTKLQEGTPTTNREGQSVVAIHKFGAADHGHGLYKFPGLSNITGPVTVSQVIVGLRQETSTAGATHSFALRRLLRDWNVTQATWNVYTTGNNWSTAGALGAGTDRVDAVSGSITGVVDTVNAWYTVTQASGGLVDDVQGWINGTLSNYGWHISRSDAENDSTVKDFAGAAVGEGSNGERPYIEVTYTAGGAPVLPTVNEAVTVAEDIAMKMHLQNLSVNEATTISESVTMHMPISLRMEKLS